ncbi:MAG: DUF6671 family protein [Synechococcales bacterium]|nr:DUF6671 family protein [Synechococcales bacterium]
MVSDRRNNRKFLPDKHTWVAHTTAVLATMHQKERAIAPLFAEELQIQVWVPEKFDTDRFGTFTRDVARSGSQLEAARAKANRVLDETGEMLAIASEGAFFPHPAFPGVPCNREIVLLLDRANGIEVVGSELSTQTNFAHRVVKSGQEAIAFAQKVGFPEHGLVVMPHADYRGGGIIKGIHDKEALLSAVERTLQASETGTVHLETDMRAMNNPSRMGVIRAATRNLIEVFKQSCPNCNCPGFAVVEQRPGLPCALCGAPTSLIRTAIHRCQQCDYQQEIPYPKGVQTADPGQCSYCNP